MESLHYLLMKSHAILSHRIMAEASQIGLTSGQPKVLDFLSKFQEADQKAIAAYCEIEPATVGSILLRMEKMGLILRRQREGNRRSLYVSLTPEGNAAAQKIAEIFSKAEEPVRNALTAEELNTLKTLLSRTYDAISSESTEERKNERTI